ncbi:hypothetical protein Dcar01_00170 [Deinococcus carri]|uniref:Uncharacterized protein n=2 Tax=Deinococcus carri TaxID=1211323 RepID=A0ABP9W4M6_9DEIO
MSGPRQIWTHDGASHVTMRGMTDDAHAQANAEQVRVLLEALAQDGETEELQPGPSGAPDGQEALSDLVEGCPL